MLLVNARPSRPLPIRITSLIDVVFILLVFFMLTTRLSPTTYMTLDNIAATSATETDAPLPQLTLDATGQLRWQQRSWAVDELIPALTAAGINEVSLQTDGRAALGDFTRSLSQLKAAGIKPHWQRPAALTTE